MAKFYLYPEKAPMPEVEEPKIDVNATYREASSLGLLIHQPNEDFDQYLVQEVATGAYWRCPRFKDVVEFIAAWTKR